MRRDQLVRLLNDQLGDMIEVVTPSGGLAVWTKWPSGYNLMRLRESCAKRDLYLPRYLLYQSERYSGIRLGFGSLSLDEISNVVEIITDLSNTDRKSTRLNSSH